MKKDRNTQGEINSGRQEGNVALDGPQCVNGNPVPVQESDVDVYSVPIEYEDVDQFNNVAPDGPQYVNAMANPAPVQESDVDDYLVPIEYEDVEQLGSNTGVYNQLDPGTIGVPQQHYSALSARPNDNDNNAASAGVYEEIR